VKRLVIMTVGKTHSGKSTFAKDLEQQLHGSIVIDQDNHAEFVNTYYKTIRPKQGPNTIKFAITRTIVDYAVNQTDLHLILSNSNRGRLGRTEALQQFNKQGFMSILVNFDIPDNILQERIATSQRPKTIFRTASGFEEVLSRQQAETNKADVISPTEDEADYLLVIKDSNEVQSVIRKIIDIARCT